MTHPNCKCEPKGESGCGVIIIVLIMFWISGVIKCEGPKQESAKTGVEQPASKEVVK